MDDGDPVAAMLIRNAELLDGRRCDVRIDGAKIAAIGALSPRAGEATIDAHGGLLLPGLHDHHIHALALSASLHSVPCGPPMVRNAAELQAVLSDPGSGWLRGHGYHESVAGLLDAAALDAIVPGRPVRVQHRGGRMWFLNSAALALLLEGRSPPPGLERREGRPTGRLFDEDMWLRDALGSSPPALATVGQMLSARGVTGMTDMTPTNDARIARHFAHEHRSGALPQKILLAGRLDFGRTEDEAGVRVGAVKIHLHEAALPSYDDMVETIAAAHALDRPVAVHCVTEAELVFTLSAFDEARAQPGDRIEHAGIAPNSAVAEIARLGLAVVSQPHFIAERGDIYRRDVPGADQPLLYRLAAFVRSGVTLAAGSDAPFGSADPWASMAAAVDRRTAGGAVIGPNEALSPETALGLYLADPESLGRQRAVAVGAAADLCLLDRDWARARRDLAKVGVRATLVDGLLVHNGIDQAPA